MDDSKVYITVSNAKKIIRKISIDELDKVTGTLYKKNIHMFSKKETKRLLGIRQFFKDPEKFSVEYYKAMNVEDTYKYVYPESQPAYHKDNSCERLNSNFKNIEVPIPIQEKGQDEVQKFRDWYKVNYSAADTATEFIYKIQRAFPYVGELNPRSIEYTNSGQEDYSNLDLSALEFKIDWLLDEAEAYYKNNPELLEIIDKYKYFTFIPHLFEKIGQNDTTLTDDQLMELLRYYHGTFKLPIKDLLVEYYRVLFNPEMQFNGLLLDKLNFRPCGGCWQ
jgi:hypothetical protein